MVDEALHERAAFSINRRSCKPESAPNQMRKKFGTLPAIGHQHRKSSCRRYPRADCATPIGSASHAGATASSQLTFHLDHSVRSV